MQTGRSPARCPLNWTNLSESDREGEVLQLSEAPARAREPVSEQGRWCLLSVAVCSAIPKLDLEKFCTPDLASGVALKGATVRCSPAEGGPGVAAFGSVQHVCACMRARSAPKAVITNA